MKEILDNIDFGRIVLFEKFITSAQSITCFNELRAIDWLDHKILMYGKWVSEPRGVSFFGDENIEYTYSGKKIRAEKWNNLLLSLKNEINQKTDSYYNSVLVNHYKDGEDYMGWHSDNEIELGNDPHIASLSFGAPRDFILRLKSDHTKKIKILLNSGDLLLMEDKIQKLWEHSLPKRKKIEEARINLTFRSILQT